MTQEKSKYIQQTQFGYYIYPNGKPSRITFSALIFFGIICITMMASALFADNFTMINAWLEILVSVMFLVLSAMYFTMLNQRLVVNSTLKIILKGKKLVPFGEVLNLHIGFDVRVMKYGSVKIYQLHLVTQSERLLLVETADHESTKAVADILASIINVRVQQQD